MKQKKQKKTGTTVMIILAGILILSTLIGLYQPSNNVQAETINVYVQLVVQGQAYQPATYETNANTTIYNLLYNTVGNIQFEQDGDMKCYGQVCNNYATREYWQVFKNNQPINDYNTIVNENELITLYYGDMINFYNVTLTISVMGLNNTYPITIQDGLTINNLLNNYESILIENNAITCLFNFCTNENNTWSIKLNNNTLENINMTLSENDELLLEYE